LEAMACDVPIVATDVGDVKNMIQPPKGGIICAHNPRDIAEKIVISVKNKETYTPRDLILKYTWESTVEKVEKIWETAIKD
ncbi:MAG: glycosyltransferase, partial [Candidatus Bathyarchaeota archaeon]